MLIRCLTFASPCNKVLLIFTEVYCDPLAKPEFGYYEPAGCTTTKQACRSTSSSTCIFYCDSGFQRIGTTSDVRRVCQPNGQWSYSEARCKGMHFSTKRVLYSSLRWIRLAKWQDEPSSGITAFILRLMLAPLPNGGHRPVFRKPDNFILGISISYPLEKVILGLHWAPHEQKHSTYPCKMDRVIRLSRKPVLR